LDQVRIKEVIDMFFNSLKSVEDKTLETGLSQHQTLDILKSATMQAIKDHPAKFEHYCKWFLNSAMYLLDEDNELLKI
tara:strand:- start:528 stop:761 length:234 start_codon:yes stop_codon:yes gene_type:complete